MEEILAEIDVHILVLSQYFWPEDFRINDLVSELRTRGHQITVLTGYPNYPDGRIYSEFKSNSKKFNIYRGAEIVRVPLFPRGKGGSRLLLNYISFVFSAVTIGVWRLRKHKIDAIFVFEPSPITVGIPAVMLRWMKKAPVTFWVLDLWPETLQAIGVLKSTKMLALVGCLVSWVYNRCDLILAQSKSFIPQIERYCTRHIKIRYFPSWSDTNSNLNEVVPAPEINTEEGIFNIMFTGNIGEAQDFPAVLKAADLLRERKDVRWFIIGDGRMSLWVKSEIERLSLTDRVFMLGRFSVDRMPSFYLHADALLVSLKDEPIFSMTIPGKLQSYLATGLPVLAMLNGEGAELIDSSGAGLTSPAGDSYALSQSILSLVSMSAGERRHMGGCGLKITSTEFDRIRLISQLEVWLGDLLCCSERQNKELEK